MIKIRDFQLFICMNICALLLIISHLSLFWFWTRNYAMDQVSDISFNGHFTSEYDGLLTYHIFEHVCIIIVFISSTGMHFEDMIDFHKFSFCKLNGDDIVLEMALDEYTIPENNTDSFIMNYHKLLYIYLNQLIVTEILKSCIRDEWLQCILCMFCVGDKDINIFYDKELINSLDAYVGGGTDDIKDNYELVLPIVDQVVNNLESTPSITLKKFERIFKDKVNKLPLSVENIWNNDIKQLISDYVKYCLQL